MAHLRMLRHVPPTATPEGHPLPGRRAPPPLLSNATHLSKPPDDRNTKGENGLRVHDCSSVHIASQRHSEGAFFALRVPMGSLSICIIAGRLAAPARRIGQRWRATRAPRPVVYRWGGPGSFPGLPPLPIGTQNAMNASFDHASTLALLEPQERSSTTGLLRPLFPFARATHLAILAPEKHLEQSADTVVSGSGMSDESGEVDMNWTVAAQSKCRVT